MDRKISIRFERSDNISRMAVSNDDKRDLLKIWILRIFSASPVFEELVDIRVSVLTGVVALAGPGELYALVILFV